MLFQRLCQLRDKNQVQQQLAPFHPHEPMVRQETSTTVSTDFPLYGSTISRGTRYSLNVVCSDQRYVMPENSVVIPVYCQQLDPTNRRELMYPLNRDCMTDAHISAPLHVRPHHESLGPEHACVALVTSYSQHLYSQCEPLKGEQAIKPFSVDSEMWHRQYDISTHESSSRQNEKDMQTKSTISPYEPISDDESGADFEENISDAMEAVRSVKTIVCICLLPLCCKTVVVITYLICVLTIIREYQYGISKRKVK